MASVITNIPESNSLEYEVMVAPLLDDPSIQALPFTMIVATLNKYEIYFNTNLDKITVDKNTCGWEFKGAMEFTKKVIEPVELAAAVKQCYKDLANSIFAKDLPTGFERGMLGPEITNILTTQQQYAFNRDLLSKLWLCDTASAVPYYASFDGVYKSLKTGVATNDGTVDSGVTLDATTLNTTNFFTTMTAVYNKRTRQMKSRPRNTLLWIWTPETYDLYISYLEVSTQNTAGIIQRENVIAGTDANTFKGIPIYVSEIVGERLESDFQLSPEGVEDPYRTILTVASNHVLAMDADGFMKQNTWYNPDLDEYRIAGSALIAYKYGYGYLNVIAGF